MYLFLVKKTSDGFCSPLPSPSFLMFCVQHCLMSSYVQKLLKKTQNLIGDPP